MSDSKGNVDVLKMYGEDSTTQRDEFLKKHNLNYRFKIDMSQIH